ncbi:YybH family protein [Nocardia sp. NPDC020380]|uniref:YybH family protein n=1 Tax=Nocardia sp. NPDC020380 TaxID=3364309 RepID=UPI00379DA8F3
MTSPDKTEEAQIRHQFDKIREALHTKDLEALQCLYSPDVISFDIEPPLQHVGVTAKLKNWSTVFTFFDTVTYEIRDLTITTGLDIAFAHAFARLTGTLANGTPTPGMWVRATYGLRKIDNIWLISHDQVSVPLDIATGKGVIDLEP